jgi:hypothetical protein
VVVADAVEAVAAEVVEAEVVEVVEIRARRSAEAQSIATI